MNINIQNSNIETILLGDLVQQKRIEMKRGKVIAKTTGKYPVYSSSIKNNGLMCYSDEYMFDEELISWSVDGGGNFFYRPRHKYSLTNVSGYIRVLDKNINCKYLYCILSLLHSKEHFDYTTKAHPSVICKMYKIPLPNIEIQEKIATILFELENKVIKQEQIITKLKEAKQSFLELLFPNNNSGIPQLRFENFTDTWEQRKLGDMLKTLKDGTHGTHQDVEIGPLLLSAKNIKSGKVIWDDSDRKISQDSYNKIHSSFKLMKGDVLLTIVGSIGETAILKEPNIMTFQRSVAILSPNDNLFSQFLHTEIQTNKFQRELDNRKSTSAQSGIYLGELSEIPIMFPSKEEQTKIGILFQSLDNLITLHQRKPFYLNFSL